MYFTEQQFKEGQTNYTFLIKQSDSLKGKESINI